MSLLNLRTNIDYTFILREPYIANRKRIYENYAGMFPTFESFCQVMDQCTENYECLVVSNNAKSNKLEDQIFWYKATAHRDFKLGSKEFWEMSKDIGSDDEDETFDPGKVKREEGGGVRDKQLQLKRQNGNYISDKNINCIFWTRNRMSNY